MELAAYFNRIDKNQVKSFSQGVGAPLVLLAIMGMVILPMPAFLLDILFSFNIALSLMAQNGPKDQIPAFTLGQQMQLTQKKLSATE